MRVNVYAEEMPPEPIVEIISKEIEGQTFTGLRIYLQLPASYHLSSGEPVPAKVNDGVQAEQLQAPFIHHPGDDDSSAITFWGKRDLRELLEVALAKLDEHYETLNEQAASRR